MKHIRRDLYSNRIIYRKYAKNYHRHNMNILTFLKSNYKYKRRNTRYHCSSGKQQRQLWHLPHRQQKYKHKFPVRNEEILTDDKQITKRNSIYENMQLDKFLRIFMLIMQQATTTTTNNNTNICNNQSKGVNSSRLVTRLVAKMKAIKKKNKSSELLTKFNVIDNDREEIENKVEDVIISGDHHLHHHYAYKDANKDTDINVDINNIDDEISHQQHNYDKVSTITSTPIKCQRRKDHQMKAIKSLSSSSPLSTSSFSLIMTTMTTSAVTTAILPSITNYETCQCSAILHHYDRHNSSFHYHQYHHKIKHIHTQYHQQQEHHQALHTMKSLMTSRVLNINNNCNISNKNKNKNQNYKNTNNSYNNKTTSSVTIGATSNNYQSFDQYVNSTCNRSYTLSCLLLTLFIALSIGVRSTTAGACWQTVLDNGKCNEIFSLNISKSECCGANQEFAYTEREPTNVEYFFATAIGGGMECSPCLESCKNVKCGPNKKCVKRKGRPKCICAPECGAARRKRKQREHFMPQETQTHTLHLDGTHIRDSRDVENDRDDNDDNEDDGYIADMATTMQFPNAFKITIEKSQQSRDTRSLSSEITNVNLGLETGKDSMMMINSGEMSPMEKHHCKEHNQNQRKSKYMHMHHTHTQANGQQQQQQSQDSNHKNQEPKGSRRLLITANVEHTEKPTTRRLQILSNVRTTHARRYNSKKNKNEHGPDEDTDPSDYDEALEEEENHNDKDYKYNDAEDDAKEPKKKNISNNNNNGNSNSNKNNRNDDSTRFLNQSMSRHKLKTNTKSNNNNNNSNKGRNRNSRNNNNNNKKNQHDLQRTKIQQHSSNNNTRIRHPQHNGRHAENTPHYRHHHQHYNHQQQQQYQPHHRQQQQQQHNLNHNHQQQSPVQGRHKHNKQQKLHHQQQQHHHNHKQQTIVLKMPKNNKDYNITTTTNNISVANTTATNNSNNNKNNNNSNNSRDTDATVTATSLIQQSRLGKTSSAQTSFNLSSAASSLSSTTPVNSTMSANDDDDAAADDHSRLPNHGNKMATSSLSPSSAATLPSTSSHLQLSAASARSSPESSSAATIVVKMSAKGEGVSLHDQNMHHIQIPTKIALNNKNNDNIISTFQSNLHNTQQQQDQQQHQTQSTQSQEHQHYQTPLFDDIYEQFDLIGFQNKQQQTITTEDNVRPLNPVCGTDRRTYNTECQLRKRACRTDNPSLQISYRGHCRTTCNGVKCLNGLTCVEDQYSKPHCIACKIECPQDDYDNDVVDATRAVCGADGKTYKSTCDINRMICKIGRSIDVVYPGPCREEQVTCDDINCGPKQVCLIDLLTHKPRCTSCRYKCSRKRRPSYPHFEEGKICGVNNHTYNSWCEMLKDSCSTGFYIDVKYSGACH